MTFFFSLNWDHLTATLIKTGSGSKLSQSPGREFLPNLLVNGLSFILAWFFGSFDSVSHQLCLSLFQREEAMFAAPLENHPPLKNPTAENPPPPPPTENSPMQNSSALGTSKCWSVILNVNKRTRYQNIKIGAGWSQIPFNL